MATKTNMERAKAHQDGFWIFAVTAIFASIFSMYIETEKFTDWRDAFSPWPLVCVIFMFFYAGRTFRALRREIADLRSGGTDDSAATQASE